PPPAPPLPAARGPTCAIGDPRELCRDRRHGRGAGRVLSRDEGVDGGGGRAVAGKALEVEGSGVQLPYAVPRPGAGARALIRRDVQAERARVARLDENAERVDRRDRRLVVVGDVDRVPGHGEI